MKLFEIIKYQNNYAPRYAEPDSKVNWSLPENPHYKYYPELQDSIFAGLSRLSVDQKKYIQDKYHIDDDLKLRVLPVDKMFELDKELHQMLQIPY